MCTWSHLIALVCLSSLVLLFVFVFGSYTKAAYATASVCDLQRMVAEMIDFIYVCFDFVSVPDGHVGFGCFIDASLPSYTNQHIK